MRAVVVTTLALFTLSLSSVPMFMHPPTALPQALRADSELFA